MPSCPKFSEARGRGASISFRSDLPPAAGLSSSSAFVTGVFAALWKGFGLGESTAFGQNIRNLDDLAEYLGCIENGSSFRGLSGSNGVGTFGGSQDHAAIVGSKKGNLAHFSFSPLTRLGDFSFPEELCFVIATSGVVAEKTGNARAQYNNLSRMVRAIGELSPEMKGTSLAAVIRARGIGRVRESLRLARHEFGERELKQRLDAFYEESFEIIPAVAAKLGRGEFDEIGALVDRSHANAATRLGNQTPETMFLQHTAREIGALAASAFGAGFGGSVYALVPAASAADFRAAWNDRYRRQFPERCSQSEFFTTFPSESLGLPFGREAG